MKGLKKLLMGLLVSIMVLGMGLTAFAAGNGTITIDNARNGQVYNAYRVFDFAAADQNDMDNGGVYTLSTKFKDILKDADFAAKNYFTVGDNGILNTAGITDENVAQFGKDVLAYAKKNNIAADSTKTAVSEKENAANDEVVKVVLTGLEYGYYVVDSSLGSAIAVDTTSPNAEIREKNSVPSLKKTVTEDSTNTVDLTGNNAQIGDTVTFTIVADLKVGGTNYKIVDRMTEGLTFNKIESVKVGNKDYAYSEFQSTDHGFDMSFAEPTEDVSVVVVYTAVVNKDAKIYDEKNENEAYLVYGNDVETVHKKTETKTYPLQIKKVAKGKENGEVLPGAVFNLYRKSNNTKVKFTVSEDGYTYTVDPAGTVEDIVTKEKNNIKINGLDAETYVLVETVAPTGYNLIEGNVTVGETTYKHAQEVTISIDDAGTVATVEDSKGLLLPETGGIGTTIFYIFGGMLILAGAAYFLVRRKAQAE
jgi:LPXTG-motif cell wall-anchored protein